MKKIDAKFDDLIKDISTVHYQLQQNAVNAINQSLTVRNWLIGYYIVEFEQNGKDRANYGDHLLDDLEKHFKALAIKNMTARRFRDYRMFYKLYPQIWRSVTAKSEGNLIWQSVTAISKDLKPGSVTPGFKIEENRLSGELIVSKLSYTHIEQLIRIKDDLKRTFYELESIKGTWSVRELKRQVSSLYFERSGLSKKPEQLSRLTQNKITPLKGTDIVKNIYAFEFLDLNIKDAVEESDLETALLDHLQEFIIELGNGFCFEKRQKRILIGENYYFMDLLFYHRVLKCHVIIELKVGAFTHGDIGQLNTYVSFVKEEISEQNDNPPIGILLVADKDHALVKFATAGMDENLFIQQYLLQLPSKDQLEQYLINELTKLK